MLTINKNDLENVIDIQCPAHYSTIFMELIEVYDPETDYNLQDFLAPFANKKFTHKQPFTINNGVRYADYLIPLFYTAYFCQEECKNGRSSGVIKEVLGKILHDFGHFHYPGTARKQMEEYYGTKWNDFHNYWGILSLSETEKERVKNILKKYHRFRYGYSNN